MLDSPLNKHNKLQVFVRTKRGVLIEISPELRIPRTFKRFAGLFCQLLQEGKIQSSSGGSTLLTASKHLPSVLLPKAAKILKITKKAPLIEKLEPYVRQATEGDKPLVFVVPIYDCDQEQKPPICSALGGDREEEEVSLSHYELTAVNVCSRVCFTFEEVWSVL